METPAIPLSKRALRILPAVVLSVAAIAFFLDEPIALAVEAVLRSDPVLAAYADDIPDLLLPFVLLLSAAMWTARHLRIRRGLRDARADFYRLCGTALPVSYIAKTVFKFLFGRIETRVWLKAPAADPRWFHPGEGHAGFPSGHMAVFAALAAACWIFYPRAKGACLFLLLLLGAALLATNYHFLSDVVAGGYLGLAVAALTFELLARRAS